MEYRQLQRNGLTDDGFDFVHRGGTNTTETQTNDTELLIFTSVGS